MQNVAKNLMLEDLYFCQ